MEQQRFVETGRDSFFGDYLYDSSGSARSFSAQAEARDPLGSLHLQADQIV